MVSLHSLGNNGIGDKGAAIIGEAIEHNQTLKELGYIRPRSPTSSAPLSAQPPLNASLNYFFSLLHRLGNNVIGDEGAIAIGAALGHNQTLMMLQ